MVGASSSPRTFGTEVSFRCAEGMMVPQPCGGMGQSASTSRSVAQSVQSRTSTTSVVSLPSASTVMTSRSVRTESLTSWRGRPHSAQARWIATGLDLVEKGERLLDLGVVDLHGGDAVTHVIDLVDAVQGVLH